MVAGLGSRASYGNDGRMCVGGQMRCRVLGVKARGNVFVLSRRNDGKAEPGGGVAYPYGIGACASPLAGSARVMHTPRVRYEPVRLAAQASLAHSAKVPLGCARSIWFGWTVKFCTVLSAGGLPSARQHGKGAYG